MSMCPHCDAENPLDASFCETCGKALALAGTSRPRVVTHAAGASTEAGQSLQMEALSKKMRSASGALLAVAILQTLFAFVIFAMMGSDPIPLEDGTELDPKLLFGMLLGIAAIFYGLYFWARKNPLPAAITGLVLYISLLFMDAVTDPESIGRGIIIKIIIIVVLAKAVSAGVQHRQLSQQLQRH